METQKKFIESIVEGDASLVKSTLELYKSNELEELLQTFTKEQHLKLWKGVYEIVRNVVKEKNFLQIVNVENVEQSVQEKIQEEFELITNITKLATCHLKGCKTIEPQPFADCLVELHGMLFELGVNKEGMEVQELVATLCETAYLEHKGEEVAEKLVPQTITYLLSKALEMGAKQVDVKRVYNMKNALLLLDLNEEDNILIELLLRAVISPTFLGCQDGRRFVVFIFHLHEKLTLMTHAAIVPQIPLSKKSILETYGDIYFKTWKNAEGQILLKLEFDCIQDLIYHAIHARDQTLFNNIRIILNAFHAKKRIRGVDDMLLKLYEPILFRALSAANATVRRNASCLLIDAFPLRNPDANKSEADALLQKQFGYLKSMLQDENAGVRVVGVEGICKILCMYWELIPPETTFALLKTLVVQMSCDANSSAVRAGVFRGLSYLLDNHLSHTSLKKLLPQLGSHINDNSQQVRSAFLDLLIRVKSVRNIRFFDIVSLDNLFLRLAVDTQAIAEKITNLLLHSYFPYNKPAKDQLNRYLSFVNKNSIAAKKFYKHVVKLAPPEATIKLIHILNKFLKKCIAAKEKDSESSVNDSILTQESEASTDTTQTKTKRRKLQNKKNNESTTEASFEDSTVSQFEKLSKDIPLIENTMEILSLLLDEVIQEIDSDKDLIKKVENEFPSNHLLKILSCFKSLRVSASIWKIAQHLPSDSIKTFTQNSLSSLEKMCETGKLQNDYKFILECVCKWKNEKKILKLINQYITLSPKEDRSSNKSRGRKKRKTSSTPSTSNPKGGIVALAFLNTLFEDPNCRARMLKTKIREDLEKTLKILKKIVSEDVPKFFEKEEEEDGDYETFLINAFHIYPKLLIHIISKPLSSTKLRRKPLKAQAKKVIELFEETPKEINDLLELYNEQILPALYSAGSSGKLKDLEKAETEKSKRKRSSSPTKEEIAHYPLSLCVCRTMCIVVGELVSLGIIRHSQTETSSKLSQFVYGFLQKQLSVLLPYIYPNLAKFIYQLLQAGYTPSSPLQIWNEVLGFYVSNTCAFKIPRVEDKKVEKLVQQRKKYIHEIMTLVMNKRIEKHYVQLVLDKCVNEIKKPEDDTLELMTEESEFPEFVSLSLEILSESPKFLKAFLVELSDALCTSTQDAARLYKLVQVTSLLVHNHSKATKDYFLDLKDTLRYVLENFTHEERVQIVSLIEELMVKITEKANSEEEETNDDDKSTKKTKSTSNQPTEKSQDKENSPPNSTPSKAVPTKKSRKEPLKDAVTTANEVYAVPQ